MNNATIKSIAKATGASAAGKILYADAIALSIRCVMEDDIAEAKKQLGATIEDATAVLYVKKVGLSAQMLTAGPKDRLGVQMDGASAPSPHEVIHVIDGQKAGGLAHFECYLRVIR